MDLHNKKLLSNIQRFNAYCDEKSIEQNTGIEKRKYKLSGRHLPGINSYPFFVLTEDKTACSEELRFSIAKNDWIDRLKGYIEEKYSYTDLNNGVETLEVEQILKKMKDSENGFSKVAKLCRKKCNELQNFIPRMLKSKKKILPETKKIVYLGMLDYDNPEIEKFKRIGMLE